MPATPPQSPEWKLADECQRIAYELWNNNWLDKENIRDAGQLIYGLLCPATPPQSDPALAAAEGSTETFRSVGIIPTESQTDDAQVGKATLGVEAASESLWHNPDNLPSPGEAPWRFLVKGEEKPWDVECWYPYGKNPRWLKASDEPHIGTKTTYRTREPLPRPLASAPAPEGRGETAEVWRMDAVTMASSEVNSRSCHLGTFGNDVAKRLVEKLNTLQRERDEARVERDDYEHRLACLLDHATGGLFSKTNYSKEDMYSFVNEHVEKLIQEANSEEAISLRNAHAAAVAQAQALREALNRRQPRIGAWENECPLCAAETKCGDIPHAADCPFLLADPALAASEAGKERTWTQQTDSYGNPVAGG